MPSVLNFFVEVLLGGAFAAVQYREHRKVKSFLAECERHDDVKPLKNLGMAGLTTLCTSPPVQIVFVSPSWEATAAVPRCGQRLLARKGSGEAGKISYSIEQTAPELTRSAEVLSALDALFRDGSATRAELDLRGQLRVHAGLTAITVDEARHKATLVAALADALARAEAHVPLVPRFNQRDVAADSLLAWAIRSSGGAPRDLPGTSLPDARHVMEGDVYTMSATIPQRFPTISVLVGRRRSDQTHSQQPTPHVRCQAEQFARMFSAQADVKDIVSVPMTTIELRPTRAGSSSLTFKRVCRAPDGAPRAEPPVAEVTRAISDARALVWVLDALAAVVDIDSFISALDEQAPKAPDAKSAQDKAAEPRTGPMPPAPASAPGAAPARWLEGVIAATSRLSGHVERRGDGVEARVTLSIGDTELRAVASVRPRAAGLSVELVADLPPVPGAPLTLAPERGMAALLRAMSELEVGFAALDDAFLVEGNPARLPEVEAAAAALVRLAPFEAHVSFEESRLAIALHEAVNEPALHAVIGAALDAWECSGRARLGETTAA